MKLLFLCNSAERIELRALPSGCSIFDKIRLGTLVDVGAYCLMTNHFHLLLHEKGDGEISNFLRKLLTAYAMYFNKKYTRKGTLFESRFQARHIADDAYFRYLYAYVHLNPVKMIQADWKEKGIKNLVAAQKFLDAYSFSSYRDFIGEKRTEAAILERKPFPEYFEDSADFKKLISDWLNYKDEEEVFTQVRPV